MASLKKIVIAAAVLLGAACAQAAPFIVSDALDRRATHCGWKVDAGIRTEVVVALSGIDKICKLDIAELAAGSHTVSATTIAQGPEFWRLESVPSENFTFVVPTTPGVPSGLRLSL